MRTGSKCLHMSIHIDSWCFVHLNVFSHSSLQTPGLHFIQRQHFWLQYIISLPKKKKVGQFNVRCFLPFSIQLQAHISLQTAVFNLVSSNVWKNFVLIYYERFSVVNSQANKDDGLRTTVIMPRIAPSLAQLNVLIEESCAFLNSEGRCYDCENSTRGGERGRLWVC